jgi:hypothetical protein
MFFVRALPTVTASRAIFPVRRSTATPRNPIAKTCLVRLLGRGVAAALIAVGLFAAPTPASARIHTCSNSEIRTVVTDAFIISCTGVGGTVKCTDSGKQTCCKKVDGYDICSPNPDNLRGVRDMPSRPPSVRPDGSPPDRANPPYTPIPPRGEPSPGRVAPPPPSVQPPRADPPPMRVAPMPMRPSGPSIK